MNKKTYYTPVIKVCNLGKESILASSAGAKSLYDGFDPNDLDASQKQGGDYYGL